MTTMLDPKTILDLALQLDHAEKTRTQLRHFSRSYPEMTVDDGYAIQSEWLKLKLAEGQVIKGRKIGLTSRAMQRASQIDEPDYAPLMDTMFIESGQDIRADRFIAPRVEVELAFILNKPLKGPGVTLFDVLDATAYVSSSIGRPKRRARSMTPSRTSRPMQPLSWAGGPCVRSTWICAGSARCFTRTVQSKKAVWPLPC
jgi:2-keto-4-pentenoate hydratase